MCRRVQHRTGPRVRDGMGPGGARRTRGGGRCAPPVMASRSRRFAADSSATRAAPARSRDTSISLHENRSPGWAGGMMNAGSWEPWKRASPPGWGSLEGRRKAVRAGLAAPEKVSRPPVHALRRLGAESAPVKQTAGYAPRWEDQRLYRIRQSCRRFPERVFTNLRISVPEHEAPCHPEGANPVEPELTQPFARDRRICSRPQ